jgi:cyclic dehypoxanthinyl futalosine synthase
VAEPTHRLTDAEALELLTRADLHALGSAADAACRRAHPGPIRTYVVDRNINTTNICPCGCAFCAFCANPESAGGPEPWVASVEDVLAEVAATVEVGGYQVLIQGGLNPALDLRWHERLLGAIQRDFPRVHVHGLSPPEIVSLARRAGVSVGEAVDRLVGAGLDTIPGGGAEILVDRVRRAISPRKCTADQWLDVMRQAHRRGVDTTATMMFGHVETPAERVEHLRRLRALQDESLAAGAGRFTAFICWPFQPGPAPLAERVGEPAGPTDYLRTLAVARLVLDNFENLQASWVTQGPAVGQLALFYGANDMGGVTMTEKVVAAAGVSHRLDEPAIRRLIAEAGFEPRRRTCRYQLL